MRYWSWIIKIRLWLSLDSPMHQFSYFPKVLPTFRFKWTRHFRWRQPIWKEGEATSRRLLRAAWVYSSQQMSTSSSPSRPATGPPGPGRTRTSTAVTVSGWCGTVHLRRSLLTRRLMLLKAARGTRCSSPTNTAMQSALRKWRISVSQVGLDSSVT